MTDLRGRLQSALGGSYQIERELGRGGMATVYLAHDLRHDRPVALKVLHPELAAGVGPERFLREIRLTARLDHPHILPVLDSGRAPAAAGNGELLWYTMPYVRGESLRDRLRHETQLGLDEALELTRQVAAALDYAHREGVVHRDLKPENILIADGQARVADLGIATAVAGDPDREERLTETGVVVGTPQYMSPEQAAGARELGPRTDIYSLGCILYEMLAGEPPYTGPTAQAILAKRLRDPLPSMSTLRQVPAPVEQAINRALARVPADRFSTAGELVRALEAAPATTPAPVRRPARLLAARPLIIAGIGLLLLLGGYLALDRTRVPGSAPASPAGTASAAVLPFVDLSPQKDQQYFSEGLTEELITTLSQVPGIRVPPRSSSFQFTQPNPDVREVGRKLDVGAVLEGSVRKSGNRLRVSAQLVSVSDGFQLWSDSYDRDLADVFAVQEDIARAIVGALRVRLAARTDSSLGSRPTADLAAYDLYLKGRFAWNQRSEASLPEAVRYFEQATARDSNFARAWAGLADTYLLLPSYASASPAVTWPRAKAAATRALALDSTSAEAYTSLAYGMMIYEWDWARSEELFHRAIAADPSYPNAHHWYGDFLTGRGRYDEALREMRRAQELDPLSRIIGAEVGWVLYTMGRNDEAIGELERTVRLDPNFGQVYFRLGMAELGKGDARKAIADLKRALELSGFYSHVAAALISAYASVGDRPAAIRLLDEMRRRAEREWVSPFAFAVAYTGLGRKTEAIDWLLKGIETRDLMMSENFNDPLLDPIRSDPRYVAVKRGMGLK